MLFRCSSLRHIAVRKALPFNVRVKNIGAKSFFSMNSRESDEDMQNRVSSLSYKLKLLIDYWQDSDLEDDFNRYVENGLISPDATVIEAYRLFIALKNPLLDRYAINRKQTLEGAIHGFDAVFRALSSKEFTDYVCGETTDSTEYDLLRDTMSDTLFRTCCVAMKDARKSGIYTYLTDVKIKNVVLRDIETEIIPFDAGIDRKVAVKRTAKSSGEAEKEATTSTGAKVNTNTSTKPVGSTPAVTGLNASTTSSTNPNPIPRANTSVQPSTHSTENMKRSEFRGPLPSTRRKNAASGPATPPRSSSTSPTIAPSTSATAVTLAAASNCKDAKGVSNTSGANSASEVLPVVDKPSETHLSTNNYGSNEADAVEEKEEEEEEEEDQPDAEHSYPPGSVVARVKVMFDVQDQYTTAPLTSAELERKVKEFEKIEKLLSLLNARKVDYSKDKQEWYKIIEDKKKDPAMLKPVYTVRDTSTTWTFSACISGQVQFEWKVTGI